MSDSKKPNPNTNFVYQPKKEINEGYQPTKSTSSQPPSKGTNVQPPKTEK